MAIQLSIISYRRLIPLLIALIAISASISFTASTFLGIYDTTANLMGDGGEDVLVIYGASARTPQTSIIPLTVYEKVVELDGVEAASPEAVAIALAGDRAVIVRGVDPTLIQEFFRIHVVEGEDELSEAFSALAGVRLARKLGLGVGDSITLRSAFSNNYVELRIVGIYESGSYLDDELLAPIFVGQWLRGLRRDLVSLIRVKIDLRKLSKDDLILHLRGVKEVEKKPSPIAKSSIMRLLALPRARRYCVECVVRSPRESMESFLGREVKINRATMWSIVFAVIFGSTLLIYLISTLMASTHSREIIILRSLGASRKRLMLLLSSTIISLSAASSIVGFILGTFISSIFSSENLITMGPYTANPSITLEVLPITVLVAVVIMAVGMRFELESILRGEYGRV